MPKSLLHKSPENRALNDFAVTKLNSGQIVYKSSHIAIRN